MINGLHNSNQKNGGPLSKLGGRFQFNNSMFELLTEDFVGEEWCRNADRGNSAHWILGHLCTMRLSLLRTLGVEQPDRIWEPLFAIGGDLSPFNECYPSTRLLSRCFRETGGALICALERTTANRAKAIWNEGEHDPPVSVEDCVGFFYFDETFHLGQLGLARQQLGKPRVI